MTPTPSDTPKLSSFALDRVHVGEASPNEQAGLGMSLDSPEAHALLSDREERFAELASRPDFDAFLTRESSRHSALAAEREEATHTLPWWQSWFTWQGMTTLATAGVAALLLLTLPPEAVQAPNALPSTQGTQSPTPRPQPTISPIPHTLTSPRMQPKIAKGCKGGCLTALETMFRVLYFRKGAPYPRWLRNGQHLHPGDLLQFSLLVTQQPAHVMIVGMNQRGEQYAFVPYQGKHSLPVKVGTLRLPQHSSLELDDYLGPERFYFFTATHPFTLAQVKKAMRGAYRKSGNSIQTIDKIPGPWQSRSLLITKRKR